MRAQCYTLRVKILLLALFAFSGQARAGGVPLVVAHRGASHDAPENTLAAFVLAWEQGADAIEGDFFLTKDGQIVCTHDATTGRLNKEKRKLEVAGSTLAELRELDVGSWRGEEWRGERMPTLAQVLETVPEGKRILIEVKCGVEIIPALKKEIAASKLKPEQITIISFQKEVVSDAKLTMPEMKAFWLASFKRDKKSAEVSPALESVIETLHLIRADGFSCGDHETLMPKMLAAVRAAGYETHCWTIDDPARAKALAEMGMQSITTNRPALIRTALSE